MNSRLLLLAVALVAILIASDALRHREGGAAAPSIAAPGQPAGAEPAIGTPGPTEAAPRRLGPLPSINDAEAGTPTLDLMARLAIRRRIEREGSRVYLDSLLANTDSTIVRWADRGDTPLVVAFQIDSTVQGWTPAMLDDVRMAIRTWDGNAAGLRFREGTSPDSADIKVRWVTTTGDSSRVGTTNLTWGADGEVHGAEIVLAIQDNNKRALPVGIRRQVATHEIGHAMGLPHSGDRDDLMHPSANNAAPSRRDQATLQLLYALPPGSLHGQ